MVSLKLNGLDKSFKTMQEAYKFVLHLYPEASFKDMGRYVKVYKKYHNQPIGSISEQRSSYIDYKRG